MLEANIAAQLKTYLGNVTRAIKLVASLDGSDKSQEMRDLLQEIAGMSDHITLIETTDEDERTPSFSISQADGQENIRFAGIPMGHEFTSLVLALLHVGGHPTKVEPETIEQIKAIEGTYQFETYISLSCQNCPEVVQALNLLSVLNPNISHVMIDGALYQDEIDERQIMSVPSVYLNGELFGQGRMVLAEIIAKKIRFRGSHIQPRDVFDIAAVCEAGYGQEVRDALAQIPEYKDVAAKQLASLNPEYVDSVIAQLMIKPNFLKIAKSARETTLRILSS